MVNIDACLHVFSLKQTPCLNAEFFIYLFIYLLLFSNISILALFWQVSASKVLQETCNYIRNLHREVDDLSDRLSALLASTDTDSDQAAIIRSLLM